MLSQDEHPISDASAQTRQTRAFLTPLSGNSPRLSDGSGYGGKKRKRDGNTVEDLLKDTFIVRPYPSTVFFKPRSLQPLILLPRSYLPLSSLDTLSSANPLPQSRLFETHVKILELEERMGSQPMVLIARLDDGRTLYAVEREDRGLYVLCQLGSWVDIRQLRAAAVVSKQDFPKTLDRGLGVAQDKAAVPLVTPEASKYNKKKRLAIEAIQSMVKRPSTGLLTESQPTTADPELTLSSQHEEQALNNAVSNEVAPQPTATEIFENVRNQYLEALYLSKASLAYFAKGPLSRARAAFHLDYDANLDMNDHIAFLESLIMSSTLIDKKFRDGVPECVSLIDIQDHSADDAKQGMDKTKKRRSSKKMKPGKGGLYPAEDVLVRKWWANYDSEEECGAPGTSREEVTKNRIAQLRIRETQLQMIVILEVLALRPLASVSKDLGVDLPAIGLTNTNPGGKEKPGKSQKPDNLTMLIDLHIDRLCIWQSIALEATKSPLDGAQNEVGGTISSKHADNILRDFCVEVIAPFFSARLPDRCAMINRKLGGPVAVSPPKPRLSKSASFSGAASRPGAATKRPVPAKPHHSLKRVLTDERERERRSVSRGPGRALSLMRSATAPTVPVLKREASEAPSLSSIPAAESQPLQANRGGVLSSKRFSQREVDLSSFAPDVNLKTQKQAIIKAELKEAISALKKPNRELAGKVMVETAEKRAASASHTRKSKKPVRNPLFQGVQITATPRGNRQKDMFTQPQHPSLSEMVEEVEMATIPPSSLPRIPQSSTRRPRGGGLTRNPLCSAVQATPTRKSLPESSQPANWYPSSAAVDYGGCPPSSPLQSRRSAQLFAAPDSAVKGMSNFSLSQGIQETPVKRRPEAALEHSHPAAPATSSDKENVRRGMCTIASDIERPKVGMKQEDIYKSLGWDDTDDIDDLA